MRKLKDANGRPMGRDRIIFNVISYVLLTLLSLICLLPFLLVVSGSFSDQQSIQLYGYQLIPKSFSLDAYKMLFRIPGELLRAYGVTIFVTLTGTLLGLLFTSMAAFVLANKDFRYRYQVSFFFYFTSIFGGGLVPWYIFNTKYLHFHNNVISLIVPTLINVTYLLILKSYMMNIPQELYESARLDGASKWNQILHITLPMLRPMIILMLLMSIGRIFNSDFGLFYQVPLNSGLLTSTTQTIDTYVYRALLQLNNVSMSSAASVFQALIGFALVMASNMLVRVVEPDNALF